MPVLHKETSYLARCLTNFSESAWMARLHSISLKGKLIVVTVGLHAIFIGALLLISVTVVQSQFEQVLQEEQFASTKRIAAELDHKVRERFQSLASVAVNLPTPLSAQALDPYLVQLGALHTLFSGGITVIGLDGKTIADFPVAPGRRGTYFGDRDYFRKVVASGKPYVDKPIMGRALKRPILTTAVPVFDRAGKLRAVMTGITDLTTTNFLGIISDRALAGKSEFYVFSPRDNTIIAATDTARVLTRTPSRGANLMYDRFVDGFEGSGIAVSSLGITKLISGKHMAEVDWIVMAALPTAVAFGPIQTMRKYLFIVAAIMTLLSFAVFWWVTRRMLKPLEDAGTAMRQMTDGHAPLAPLVVRRRDEIGQMIDNFNRLVEDRQRYEAALMESEQRFRLLVEGAPDAIMVQANGCFAYLNAAALRLFGASSEDELRDQPVLGRIHPASRQPAEERFNLLIQNKLSTPPLEKKYLRLDGIAVDVEVSAVPFRFNNQDGALMFVRDITERKCIAEELLRKDEEFRALVENSPDVIIRYDRYFRCVYANPAIRTAVGLQSEKILGKTTAEMGLPQEFVVKWTACLQRVVVAELPCTFEFSIQTPSGIKHFHARMVPEFGSDGQILTILTVARDISVIKGGEAVLRESEERFHGITANMPGMVFQCQLRIRDGALMFTYVSEGSKLLLGLAPEQIQSDRKAIAERLAECERPDFYDSLRHSALTMGVWNWEGRTITVDGEARWINCRATPRFGQDGDIIWEGVMLNITESKRGEEEIMQSRQLLRDLSAHTENVREEERKRIAREVHDELGQSLTVLRMDAALLRLNFGGQSPQLMERIQSMTEVVDRTIGIMRSITSTLRPVALDLGLTAALEWLVEDFVRRTEIDCRLRNYCCDEVELDDARATALFRIVQESLTNVIKHAEATEVEILIEREDEGNLCLHVRDNGKGFMPETARKTGTFGLVGMRERVLMLHGALTIESVPGHGARIEVCIPLEVQRNALQKI